MKHRLRKNIPKKSEGHTRNESVEVVSNNLEKHAQPFHCELGDGYCEITEVSDLHHTRHNDLDQTDSTK